MTLEELKKEFKKHGEIVTMVVDYDSKFLVVEAVKSLDHASYNDPYYIIDKKTGKTAPFSFASNPKKYFDAVEKRTLYKMSREN